MGVTTAMAAMTRMGATAKAVTMRAAVMVTMKTRTM